MVSGKGARTKGHQWERDVVNSIKDLDMYAKRMLEYQEGLGIDIDTSLPYLIQCKSQKRVNWLSALSEIPHIKDKIPVVAGKVTGKGEFAFLRWSDFIILMKQAHIHL